MVPETVVRDVHASPLCCREIRPLQESVFNLFCCFRLKRNVPNLGLTFTSSCFSFCCMSFLFRWFIRHLLQTMVTIALRPLLQQCIAVIESGIASFDKFHEYICSLKFDSHWLSGTTHWNLLCVCHCIVKPVVVRKLFPSSSAPEQLFVSFENRKIWVEKLYIKLEL